MKYSKFTIEGKAYYIPCPENWEELKYSLHNESGVMDYDPNNLPDYSDIVALF